MLIRFLKRFDDHTSGDGKTTCFGSDLFRVYNSGTGQIGNHIHKRGNPQCKLTITVIKVFHSGTKEKNFKNH